MKLQIVFTVLIAILLYSCGNNNKQTAQQQKDSLRIVSLDEKARKLFDEGNEYMNANNYAEALASFEDLIHRFDESSLVNPAKQKIIDCNSKLEEKFQDINIKTDTIDIDDAVIELAEFVNINKNTLVRDRAQQKLTILKNKQDLVLKDRLAKVNPNIEVISIEQDGSADESSPLVLKIKNNSIKNLGNLTVKIQWIIEDEKIILYEGIKEISSTQLPFEAGYVKDIQIKYDREDNFRDYRRSKRIAKIYFSNGSTFVYYSTIRLED